MRVTSQTLPSSLANNLQRLAQRQYQLQNEAATGKKTEALAEDPKGIQRLITLQTDARSLQQFHRNAEAATQQITDTSVVIRAMKTLSDRASEIAIKADPITDGEALQNYATEINQLLEAALAQSNHQTARGYTFAGTRSTSPPYTAIRNADGQITSVEYDGNQSETRKDIAPEYSVATNTIGSNETNAGPPGLFVDARNGADFFGHLISLRDHLMAGDVDAIQAGDIQALEADEDNFLFHLSSMGSLQFRIETSQAQLTDHEFQIKAQSSALTDADLAETIVSLNQAQTAYQAALQSGAQILSSSLMDYIR